MLETFIDRLTDAYRKNPESNVYKLAQLACYHIQENADVLERIQAWRDIDQAEGVVLDEIGRDIGQNRGIAPDNVYRTLIKAKIKRNLSDGSVDTIIDFLSFILSCDKTEIAVTELWPEGKHATLNIEAPVGPISSTGLTVRQFGTLINLVIVGGVRAEVLFEGTFELADLPPSGTNGPIDAAIGLAPLDQSVGGTLGILFDPDTDEELPF